MTSVEGGFGKFGNEFSIAQRRARTLITLITEPAVSIPSTFGERLSRAITNPVLRDHNGHHTDEVKKLTKFIVRGLGTERRVAIQPHLDSIALFADLHDSGQLLTLQRNIDEDRKDESAQKNKKLNAKQGHGLEAAGMTLALAPRYAEVNGISLECAREICAKAAVMFIRHEDIYSFEDSLKGREVPKKEHDVTELELLMKENRLDLMAISPKDILTLVKSEKVRGKFPVDDANPFDFGFDPGFQTEFASELANLSKDEKPLFESTPTQTRESLCVAAHVALAPDIIAMTAPAEQALERLMLTQYSQNRPFYIGPKETVIDLIRNGDGNGFGESMKLDSDVYRILWQLVHQEHLLLNNPVFSSHEAMKNYLRVNALNGISLLKLVGRQFMNGETDILDNIRDVNGELIFDRNALEENLIHKPLVKGQPRTMDAKGIHIYDEQDIVEFEEICDQVYTGLTGDYGIPEITLDGPISAQGVTSTLSSVVGLESKVAKQYHRVKLWDTVPLNDPLKRAELTTAELQNLGLLAQSLNAVLAFARDGDYRHEEVIMMDRVDQDDFLASRQERGDVTSQNLKDIAATIVKYQFANGVCPTADFKENQTMTTFLDTLLLGGSGAPGEVGILEKNGFVTAEESVDWRHTIREYIKEKEHIIDARAERFGEPVMGHGDIKSDNIAIDKSGVVSIIDIAPWNPWRINDRRMDAMFLWAELMIDGKDDLAQAYWNWYDEFYRESIGIDTLHKTEKIEAEKGIEVIDAISKVYRFMIFYRLASKNGNEPRTQSSLRLLKESIENLKEK